MLKKSIFIIICPFLCCIAMYAARPFVTDDARVTPRNACQIETWAEVSFKESSSLWALPACNLIWDTEITLGGSTSLESDIVQFQIKKLFVNADEERCGIGIAIGNTYNHFTNQKGENDLYMYIPATINFLDSRLVFHLNAGYKLLNVKRGRYNLGIGTEIEIIPQLYFVGESYYVQTEPVMYQIGLRIWAIPDSLQIDVTYGNAFTTNISFMSVGFRFISPKLF